MKRLFALLLAMIMIFSAIPSQALVAVAEELGDDSSYNEPAPQNEDPQPEPQPEPCPA